MDRLQRIGVAAGLAVSLLAPVIALSETANQAAMDAFAAANDRMMRHMGMKMSGDPDKDFVMMMIPHHQGAVDMAKVELQYGKDPKLRAMAETIVKSQEKEIAEMKDWQQANP
jgi:uncharacterized protein (DUF305 family)